MVMLRASRIAAVQATFVFQITHVSVRLHSKAKVYTHTLAYMRTTTILLVARILHSQRPNVLRLVVRSLGRTNAPV
jgi:hypothetical protein